jgi:hypothetical protein
MIPLSQKDAAGEILMRRRARRSLAAFIEYVDNNYQLGHLHRRIIGILEQMMAGHFLKAMVFCPPQHGKSRLIAEFFPAYLLARGYGLPIGVAGYAAFISIYHSKRARAIFNSDATRALFPDTYLPKSMESAHCWMPTNQDGVETGGMYRPVGVGGALTGLPLGYAIIDDPYKNMAEAESPAKIQQVWDWYESVFATRCHKDTRQLIVTTRWTSYDLAQQILDRKGAEYWKIFRFPCESEGEGDILGRPAGEPLAPELNFDKEWLRRTKESKSEKVWNALYQQDPRPSQGAVYYAFKMSDFPHGNIDSKIEYIPSKSIEVAIDFNVNPMTATLSQIDDLGLVTFDEIILPDSNTRSMITEIQGRFPGANIHIYPDATGSSRDPVARVGETNISLLKEAFGKHNVKVNKTNPHVPDRVDSVNRMLCDANGRRRARIHPRCRGLINDFLQVQFIDGSLVMIDKSNPTLTHLSDGYGYMTYILFPLFGSYKDTSQFIEIGDTGRTFTGFETSFTNGTFLP